MVHVIKISHTHTCTCLYKMWILYIPYVPKCEALNCPRIYMSCEVEDHVWKGNENECVCTECADKGTGDLHSKSHSLPRFKISSLEFISPAQFYSPSLRSYPKSAACRHATKQFLSPSISFRNAYRTRTCYFVVSPKLTARAVHLTTFTSFGNLLPSCCPY